ncbi:MAG TPA: hypothetical protein VGZ73_18530 [Bryobacteraceae bacterium]|jgi:hypothetical protein|nr:hypothetical protein [Bryobacteraceae bacterium]
MAKEEKPLEYQRRIRDTKGVAQRLDLDYLKRTPLLLLLRKKATWILLAVTALASVPLVLGLAGSHRSLSTGPLSASHAVFEGRCEVCHAVAFSKVQDTACQRCHDGAAHPASLKDTAEANMTVRCAECHAEHKGQVRLGRVANGNCTRCHADLAKHATGLTIKAREISSFREEKHPEFSTAALHDDRPFKLNHKKHIELDPAKFPRMRLPMKCEDCHNTDLASRTGDLIPMTFEASCKSCHKKELQFDRYQVLGDMAQESPHTRDQQKIRRFIDESYQKALDADPSLSQRPIGIDAVVISNRDAWLAKVTTDSYEYLFDKKCPYCHQMESQYEVKKVDPRPPQSPTAPEQAPLGIKGRYPTGDQWFERSEFSHRSHREMECESCHKAARTSEKTEDVLIPKMESCLPCHGQSRADLDRCSECHLYHNRSLERERERRPTEKIIGQLPVLPNAARTLVSAAPSRRTRLVSAHFARPDIPAFRWNDTQSEPQTPLGTLDLVYFRRASKGVSTRQTRVSAPRSQGGPQ